MATFRLTLEYDGTDFEGWQAQPDGHRTVQGTLEEALAALFGEAVSSIGAGRTDAGVHAAGQVASFCVDTQLDVRTIANALNARLPADLVVLAVERAADDFYALRGTRAKCYRYVIWNGVLRSPLRARRSHWVRRPLDLERMRIAAKALEGEHDFSSFQATGSGGNHSVRTIRRIAVSGEPGDEVAIEVEGDGFLRHMVRNVVGTLVEVGLGARAPESVSGLLAARDRTQAGPTAPACGLTLLWVDYAGDRPRS